MQAKAIKSCRGSPGPHSKFALVNLWVKLINFYLITKAVRGKWPALMADKKKGSWKVVSLLCEKVLLIINWTAKARKRRQFWGARIIYFFLGEMERIGEVFWEIMLFRIFYIFTPFEISFRAGKSWKSASKRAPSKDRNQAPLTRLINGAYCCWLKQANWPSLTAFFVDCSLTRPA